MQHFERDLEKNIFQLQRDLEAKTYRHGRYCSFFVHDPKVRHIRKAGVRDRLVHQVVYTALMRVFEPSFINEVYSSRHGKGTHAGVDALRRACRKVSRNNTRPCWALKCDVQKFYDSVDHAVLRGIIEAKIRCCDLMWLIDQVIGSFHTEDLPGKGVPIGNLTSQVFANIYLSKLDWFVKQTLGIKHYIRFADDFVMLSHSRIKLETALPRVKEFLSMHLRLSLHPAKITCRPLNQGVDFLGYITFPHHRLLRTSTRRRMLRKLSERLSQCFKGEISRGSMNQSLQSYLGILSHADTYNLESAVRNLCSMTLPEN